MALPTRKAGDPHVAAHNDERALLNSIQNLSDPDFKAGLNAAFAGLDPTTGEVLDGNGNPVSGTDPDAVHSDQVSRVVAAESGTTPVLADGDLVVYYSRAGAHYFTNFADDTVEAHPAGFSEPWQDQAWLVKSVPDATGGKALTVDSPSGNSLYALLTWDAVDADTDRADAEILYRVRSVGASYVLVASAARASGTEAGRTGSRMGTHSTTTVAGSKYVSGTWFSSPTYTMPVVEADVWYMVRARVEGTTQKVKVWKDTDVEPAWQVENTDTTITAAGWVGLLAYGMPNRQEIDWVAVATGGRTAAPW